MSYFKNGTSAEVLEENNYYPFGLKHEGYNVQTGNPITNILVKNCRRKQAGVITDKKWVMYQSCDDII
ncbi:hypothetical protein [Chryseobacterium ginsengisoli]|uniref:hypothetical protein n=1 Tax=Chryseobacterium ginsengisoli TaxID=363853 RepID=UPI0031E75A4C